MCNICGIQHLQYLLIAPKKYMLVLVSNFFWICDIADNICKNSETKTKFVHFAWLQLMASSPVEKFVQVTDAKNLTYFNYFYLMNKKSLVCARHSIRILNWIRKGSCVISEETSLKNKDIAWNCFGLFASFINCTFAYLRQRFPWLRVTDITQ